MMHQSFDHLDGFDGLRGAQALSFAYGNAASSTRHKPQRRVFEKLAMGEFGWTEDQFNRWARQRRWWYSGMLLDVPARSDEALVRLRIQASADDGEPKDGFTCDACDARFTCAFVFDGYNTNGDCLAEK